MMRVIGMLGFVALCTVAAGCGGGGIVVDGKVVKGGSPYSLAEGESISISLRGDDATATANVEKDGTFIAKSPNGEPVKPGKYKVSVIHYVAPAAGSKTPPTSPMPKDAGETWEVSSTTKSFTLDMAKYK